MTRRIGSIVSATDLGLVDCNCWVVVGAIGARRRLVARDCETTVASQTSRQSTAQSSAYFIVFGLLSRIEKKSGETASKRLHLVLSCGYRCYWEGIWLTEQSAVRDFMKTQV